MVEVDEFVVDSSSVPPVVLEWLVVASAEEFEHVESEQVSVAPHVVAEQVSPADFSSSEASQLLNRAMARSPAALWLHNVFPLASAG